PVSPDWTMLSSAESALWLKTDPGTSVMLSNTNDSVGIGNTMPEEKLDVSGNLALDSFQPLILFQEDSADAAVISHNGPPYGGILHLQAWDGTYFETTGLVVKSPYQLVGVGTTNPLYRLDVSGTSRMDGFILSMPTDSGYILTSDANGIGKWQPPASHIAGSGDPDHIAMFSKSDTLKSSVIEQSDDGNIGIGVSDPVAKLDVNGQLHLRDNIQTAGNWLSGDGADEGVFVTGDGKVGIGISNPSSPLTSGGMIETMAGGVKFPDGTIQETASNSYSSEPKDAADPRWVIGMEIGGIPGSWNPEGCEDCMKVFDMNWWLFQPYDTIFGQMTGFRHHHVLTVMKDIDKASPRLMNALVQGQEINSVKLHFYLSEPEQPGTPPVQPLQPYYDIWLDEVYVVAFHHTLVNKGNGKFAHMDKISFIYDAIRVVWWDGNIEAVDHWH
ncbi:MAG: type VI secretion system tube protein Hcp, partial [Bacteroidetes bacterium]|nr:type VI secretion system tube protein Hcp [Bacteroidota bacterium]